MCDYILFAEEGAHLFVFLIELKKGRINGKKQLDSGECFAKYLISTIKRLDQTFVIPDDNIHFKQIQINESRSKKKKLAKDCVKQNGVFEHPNQKDFHIHFYLD